MSSPLQSGPPADMSAPTQSTFAQDGTRLAYRTYGAGEVCLVLTNGYSTSSFYWRHVIEHLRRRVRLVTWDLKGHGASDPARTLEGCTIESAADDLGRVMEAAGARSAVLVGFSLGCQIVLEAWRHFPERIDALVPILGTYERPFGGLLHPRVGALAARTFERLAPRLGASALRASERLCRSTRVHRLNQLSGLVGRRVSFDTMRAFYEHLGVIDPTTWAAMGIAAEKHSARDLLPTISVPVLVVSGGRDTFTPAARGKEMADAIPGSEYFLLPEAGHTGLFEYPEEINARLDAFLRRHRLLTP